MAGRQLEDAPNIEPRLVGRRAASLALGIGDRKLRQLLAAGEIESVRIGDRRLIPVDAIDAYVAKLRANGHGDRAAPVCKPGATNAAAQRRAGATT